MLRPMDYERKLFKQSLQEYRKNNFLFLFFKEIVFVWLQNVVLFFDKRKGSSRDRI